MLLPLLLAISLNASPEDVAAPTDAPAAVHLEPDGRQSVLLQGTLTLSAAAVAVPLSLWLGVGLGTLSNQLLAALVPALLVMGFLPPLVVSLVSWFSYNAQLEPGEGRAKFWLPFLATVVVNIAVMVAGGFLGVSLARASSVMLLALIDAVGMTGANVGLMRLLGPSQVVSAGAPSAITATDHRMADWAVLSSASF